MDGFVYNKEKREQSFDGVNAGELHALAEHPETFTNKFGNLKKIYDMINEAKDYASPVFASHPEIMPDFADFIKKFKEEVNARGEAYNFWENTQGGIRAEDEEIKENPRLKKLKEEQMILYRKEAKMEDICTESAIKLQEKYDATSGNKTDPKTSVGRIKKFWTDQMMIYDIYQKSAPKLLAEKTGRAYKEIDTGLRRNS